jgi:hypothetical protein
VQRQAVAHLLSGSTLAEPGALLGHALREQCSHALDVPRWQSQHSNGQHLRPKVDSTRTPGTVSAESASRDVNGKRALSMATRYEDGLTFSESTPSASGPKLYAHARKHVSNSDVCGPTS